VARLRERVCSAGGELVQQEVAGLAELAAACPSAAAVVNCAGLGASALGMHWNVETSLLVY
jgi:hypothetical protein